jgi:hypothetical protein
MRPTIKGLEQEVACLRKRRDELLLELAILRSENSNLHGVVKIYQQMSVLPIACEKVVDSLAHVIVELKRKS